MGPTHEAHYKRFVHKIDPSKRCILSREIKSELHLNQIADKLINWEEKCYLFHLKSNPDVYDIHNGKYNSSPPLQRYVMLLSMFSTCGTVIPRKHHIFQITNNSYIQVRIF